MNYDNFEGKRIAVIGDIMLDVTIHGHIDRMSPEAPVPIFTESRTEYSLGGAGNVAANIKSLGGIPILIGLRGRDKNGEILSKITYIENQCKETIFIHYPEIITTTKTRYVVNGKHIFRVDVESIENIVEDEIFKEQKRILSKIECDAYIISDYAKGCIGKEIVGWLRKKNPTKPIIVDPKNVDIERYRGATLIKPNEKEFMAVRDEYFSLGCDILITKGEKGMIFYPTVEQGIIIQGHTHEVSDVTGAGDSVTAILTMMIACGATHEEAAKVANYGAGIAVSHFGTYHVTREDLPN